MKLAVVIRGLAPILDKALIALWPTTVEKRNRPSRSSPVAELILRPKSSKWFNTLAREQAKHLNNNIVISAWVVNVQGNDRPTD